MAKQTEQDWQLSKKTVLERSRHMCNNPLMSNIMFTCGDGSTQKSFFAHKYVLATSSPVFYAMFYGDLAETKSVIHLPDTDDESMEVFLRFLYTDECALTPENAARIIYLAKKYMIPSLEEKGTKVLQRIIKSDNVFSILEQIEYLDVKELEKECWIVICGQTNAAITSRHFVDISKSTLDALLKKETLNIKETDLFKAVLEWSDKQCLQNGLDATVENKREVLGDIVYQIRFLSMSEKEFSECVFPSGILTAGEMLEIYENFSGVGSPASNLPFLKKRREVSLDHGEHLRFSVFSDISDNLHICSETMVESVLTFSVSEDAVFHGVCLYSREGESYNIKLSIKDVEIEHEHKAENNRFDLVLPEPIIINPSEIVTLSVSRSHGIPPKDLGCNGKASEEIDGLCVKFEDSSEAKIIDKIILSRLYIME